MITIRTLPAFDHWFTAIKDKKTSLRGEGVFELREHFGSGWRMYYVQRGSEIIVMLGGGDNPAKPPILPRRNAWRPL